ncbi:MAG: class I SAM-dependent rRNA methyltransferase [Thermoanaerobaculia bacterium]
MNPNDVFAPAARRRLLLRPGKERALSNRHPWIFSGAIAREEGPPDAAIGDLIDARGTRLATGFYSSASQIRLRALTFDSEDLTPDLLRARIAASIARRAPLAAGGSDAYRLVNAEGDDLTGLVVDRYGDAVVVEITSAGLDRLRGLVADTLRAGLAPRSIYFHNDVPARKIERLPLESSVEGEEIGELTVTEHGLRFLVTPREGQKTGFFLDQRENRALARSLAASRNVLNLFAYSGAFGVAAAAGGAREVEEVDISAPAIELARRNHALNPTDAALRFTTADVFDYVRKLGKDGGRAFDLLVCDPPAFAKSRGEVDRAARGYKDVNLFAMKLVAPGGLMMTFSCSGHVSLDLFQKIIFAAALDSGRRASILRRLGAGSDHPVSLYCPEGEYLKGFLLRVE